MTPIKQNILFKPFETQSTSVGGIIVPDSFKVPSNKGVIVAVGRGSKEKPMKLKQGQIGYRVKDWGEPIVIDGELHFLMDQSAIIASE